MLECPTCSGLNNEGARFCRHCGSPLYDSEYSSTKLPLGTILDEQYKIIDYVAKGGMGAVYKAVDLQKSAVWAVKEMLDYFDSESEREYAVERFATEAQILYELDHDSIPKFVDCFVSENRYYLIMEFVDGNDLLTILDLAIEQGRQGLDEAEVAHWGAQICNVLYYLHTQDPPIIYRDLKPGNIMITRENKVYLIDFGIARLFDPRTKGTMVGTQGYAPPEQYKGEAEPRSDMYSLAACMHHLLTGKDPRSDIPFNFPRIRSIREDLSEKMELILDKALAMDPQDRFNNLWEMGEALRSKHFPPPYIYDDMPEPEYMEAEDTIETEIPPVEEFEVVEEDLEIPHKPTTHLSAESLKELEGKRLSFWYMFRSDRRHSGKSPFGKNLTGRLKWSYNAESDIRSSPIIGGDGTIYVGSNNGLLHAVLPDGSRKWTFETKGRITSSPSLNSDGNILFGSTDCYLYMVDPEGREVWKFRTYGRLRSSPCTALDGTIYIGSYDHYLYAIRPDGKIKWRLDLEGYVESTPAITDNGSLFVASKGAFNGGSYIYCLDSFGKVHWYTKVEAPIKSSPCIGKDGCLYIGAMDGGLYCFSQDGSLKWKFETDGPVVSSPVLDEGKSIVFGSFDRNVYSLNPDGNMKWSYRTLSSITSSPVMAGNKTVIIGGDDYYIYGFSESGGISWKIKCGGRVRSSAAIGEDNVLYVGSDDGFLYAIE